jgi:hypothetical protein
MQRARSPTGPVSSRQRCLVYFGLANEFLLDRDSFDFYKCLGLGPQRPKKRDSYRALIIGASALPSSNRLPPPPRPRVRTTPVRRRSRCILISACRLEHTAWGASRCTHHWIWCEWDTRRQTMAKVHATGLALDKVALHQHRDRALRSTASGLPQ